MCSTFAPISAEELETRFSVLDDFERIALAVSGGSDSLALLLLVSDYLESRAMGGPEMHVLTVDHGLRAEAKHEIERVETYCRQLGCTFEKLEWSGKKPRTGIQEAAREARYTLMADYCHAHRIPTLLTAHHLDDQAETLIMRLSRGSGLDGLSGMSPRSSRLGIEIFRPLLDIPKERLRATLRQRNWEWVEDKSNSDVRFERAQLRQNWQTLDDIGLSSRSLSLSSRRLQRTREALVAYIDGLVGNFVSFDPHGFIEIRGNGFSGLMEEVQLRILSRCIHALGGQPRPPQLAKLEDLQGALSEQKTLSTTLGGCLIEKTASAMILYREVRSDQMDDLTIDPGETKVWDRRFQLQLASAAPRPLRIGHLGPKRDFNGSEELKRGLRSLPHRARPALLSAWLDDHLIALPQLDYYAPPDRGWPEISPFRCEFLNYPQIFGRNAP